MGMNVKGDQETLKSTKLIPGIAVRLQDRRSVYAGAPAAGIIKVGVPVIVFRRSRNNPPMSLTQTQTSPFTTSSTTSITTLLHTDANQPNKPINQPIHKSTKVTMSSPTRIRAPPCSPHTLC
jgi:hypothetical protein